MIRNGSPTGGTLFEQLEVAQVPQEVRDKRVLRLADAPEGTQPFSSMNVNRLAKQRTRRTCRLGKPLPRTHRPRGCRARYFPPGGCPPASPPRTAARPPSGRCCCRPPDGASAACAAPAPPRASEALASAPRRTRPRRRG